MLGVDSGAGIDSTTRATDAGTGRIGICAADGATNTDDICAADGATNTDDADDGRGALAADDAGRRTVPTGLAVRLARGPAAPARDAGEGLLAPVVWRAETFWALSDPASAVATPAPLARAAPTPNVTAPAPNQTYLSVRRPLARCLPLAFTDLAFDRVDARFISTSPAPQLTPLTCRDITSVHPVFGN